MRDGRGDQAALIHDSPVTGTTPTFTYAELLDRVATFAGALASLGVEKGDRVVVYMPMVPEAVVAMLACARLGAVHSVVFGGFAPAELAARIEDAKPVVIVAASCGIEPTRIVEYKPMLDAALDRSSHKPETVVVLQREQCRAAVGERDTDWEELDWDELVADAEPTACVDVEATDPLYVLYTSGTTGRPKGIVRDNGGHAVALRWSMGNVYGIEPGDVWFTASDVGWVVGHSYIVYAPLLTGATTVLYEGKPVGTPDAERLLAGHRRPRRQGHVHRTDGLPRDQARGPHRAPSWPGHDLSTLETVFLAGERLDPDTYEWASRVLGVPVVDNWWQTETGWPIAANLRGLEPMPIKAGSPSVRVPGYDVRILDDQGAEVPPGAEGAIAIHLPLPPGTLPTLWQDDERYVAGYLSVYEGYYLTGDGGLVDEDGYVYVMGRTDDVLNVAGHRLSTGSIEAALAGHPDVAECAVIGVADELQGPGAARARRAQGRGGCRGRGRAHPGRARAAGARRGGRRRQPPAGRHRGRPAQDPLGQDPAQDDARARRRQGPDGARHDRGRLGARRARARPPARRLRPGPGRRAGPSARCRPPPPLTTAARSRYCPGVTPTRAVKSRVKWAWSYQP